MIKTLLTQSDLPSVFVTTENEFWTDPYISEQLLNAHLHQETDGASRTKDFITASFKWISEVAPVSSFPRVIDLGCGPGLYTELLAKNGYQAHGIDFSSNSIAYAKKRSVELGLSIDYSVQNYLDWSEHDAYDLALLLYCDYGALNSVDRKAFLKRIHSALEVGGKLILDVFSIKKLSSFAEKSNWDYHKDAGFWAPGSHITLSRNVVYDEAITLEQTFLLEEDRVRSFNIWHQYFSLDKLSKELNEAGFTIAQVKSELTGKQGFDSKSDTIALVAVKE